MSTRAHKAAILAAMAQPQGAEPCPDCAEHGGTGYIIPGEFELIRYPMVDEEGNRLFDKAGAPRYTGVRRARHVLLRSVLEPSGLAPAACAHGAGRPASIDPESMVARTAKSYIRPKYLDTRGACPICRGEERPADMTESLVAAAP